MEPGRRGPPGPAPGPGGGPETRRPAPSQLFAAATWWPAWAAWAVGGRWRLVQSALPRLLRLAAANARGAVTAGLVAAAGRARPGLGPGDLGTRLQRGRFRGARTKRRLGGVIPPSRRAAKTLLGCPPPPIRLPGGWRGGWRAPRGRVIDFCVGPAAPRWGGAGRDLVGAAGLLCWRMARRATFAMAGRSSISFRVPGGPGAAGGRRPARRAMGGDVLPTLANGPKAGWTKTYYDRRNVRSLAVAAWPGNLDRPGLARAACADWGPGPAPSCHVAVAFDASDPGPAAARPGRPFWPRLLGFAGRLQLLAGTHPQRPYPAPAGQFWAFEFSAGRLPRPNPPAATDPAVRPPAGPGRRGRRWPAGGRSRLAPQTRLLARAEKTPFPFWMPMIRAAEGLRGWASDAPRGC